MQDSLEDYIKLSKSSKSEDPIKISKDVQITAKLKKECDKRAMKIVEFSIEGKLRPETFVRCLTFINQEHYQDIVEERSIIKLCGYSICGKRIPDMPKQQYFISSKSNRIYDITDRKNYCSNFCYKASLHIKNQIENSPLWLRKPEDVPDFKLLPATEGGLPGEYIDQGISKPVSEPVFTTISSFTEASLGDMVEKETQAPKSNKSPTSFRKCSKLLKSTMQTINENNEQVEEEVDIEPPKKVPEKVIKIMKSDSNKQIVLKLPVIDENEEKSEIKENIQEVKDEGMSPKAQKKSKKKTKPSTKHEVESHIQKSLKEWLTLESYIFIFGETMMKAILSEKKLGSLFDSLHIEELDQSQQIKYMLICKRLQLQEMADKKFDKSTVGQSKLKRLPDYRKLKEDGNDLDLKVRAFYTGALYEKEDTNFPTNKCVEEKNDGPPAVLPLLDANSQNALRRKIFLNSINKGMQVLLQALRVTSYTTVLADLQTLVKTFKLNANNIVFKPVLWNYISILFINMMQVLLQALRVTSYTTVLADLQTLVKTFKLNANNIVFKPVLWNYISILFINILALRDKDLAKIVEEKRSQEYFELILSSLPSKTKLLTDTMTNIKNIDLFIENYITSKDL